VVDVVVFEVPPYTNAAVTPSPMTTKVKTIEMAAELLIENLPGFTGLIHLHLCLYANRYAIGEYNP